MYSSPVRRSLQVAPPSARLACVRHAASVQSEPGSNSSVQKLHSNPRRRHYSSSYKHVLATFYSVALPCDSHKVFAERPHKTLLQIVKYLRYLQPQATNAALNPNTRLTHRIDLSSCVSSAKGADNSAAPNGVKTRSGQRHWLFRKRSP